MAPGTVVTSGWYAANIGGDFVAVEDALGGGRLAGVLARTRIGRGLLIFRAARRGRGAALLRRERGALTALVAASVFRGPPIVILELIPDRPARAGWRRTLKQLWFRCLERPAVRHGMRAGQALSSGETASLAALYGIGRERIFEVGWALSRTATQPPPEDRERAGVLSSGRAACDWETLFAAARGREWPLTVVCGAEHRARVDALNADGRARVLSEIPRDEHDALMGSAAVFAMALVDDGLSSGQVRLMTATELGTPVVASAVATLGDYVVAGETAVLVEPGDPEALRTAIESLLADPERRRGLAATALERARGRTYADYFREVGEAVERALGN